MAMSWHNTAKSFGSLSEVNAAVVQGSTVFLPGEASFERVTRLQSAAKCFAPRAVMYVVSTEESADGIVVVSEPVSSRCLLGVVEDCGKLVRSKARTWRASVNRIQSLLAADCFRGEPTLLYSIEPSGTAGYGPVCPSGVGAGSFKAPRYPISSLVHIVLGFGKSLSSRTFLSSSRVLS